MKIGIRSVGALAAVVAAGLAAALTGSGSGARAQDPAATVGEAVAVESPDDFVAKRCGTSCHEMPDPGMLSKDQWSNAIELMKSVMLEFGGVEYPPHELQKVLIYYRSKSLQRLPKLPPDPGPSRIRFVPEAIGLSPTVERPPTIANIEVVDFDGDGVDDILLCDAETDRINWIRRTDEGWSETKVASVAAPAHTAMVDHNGDGHQDLVVASLGTLFPSNEPIGKVVLLTNDGDGGFTPSTILEGIGRVADVQPADLDSDGDMDYAVAVFGHLKGGIGWLRQEAEGAYTFSWLYELPGGIHVPIADVNGDGHLDIIGLVAQAREEIIAFLGDGKGAFTQEYIFQAGTPMYGSSGIEVVDLDQDGDADVLYTNGDSFDMVSLRVPASFLLRPHHGVRWLENKGDMTFERHELLSLYGAFGAKAGDIDQDGDLDVLVLSMFNDWPDERRQSILWLENDGGQKFSAYGLGSNPSHLVTAALGDLDGDGRLDAVTGGMHVTPPFDRIGRVTLWKNRGTASTP